MCHAALKAPRHKFCAQAMKPPASDRKRPKTVVEQNVLHRNL
jgi:hypothetical protein